jgi:A/G-specific adenine glycosylase
MAQQTQIARVALLWPQMMAKFPTPEAMAKGDEQDVLSLWKGLGYYRRAKYLKATAEMIVADFDGEVPRDVDLLQKLPGIGKYTSGAIASLAFGDREPIVDGNVHRVLCRFFDQRDTPSPTTWTWDLAEQLVDSCKQPKLFNEGLMEFGATVCTPKSPSCSSCPLNSQCKAYKNNAQAEIPPPKVSVTKQHVYHYAVIAKHGNELAFEQRSEQGLWAGMWQVPTLESPIEMSEESVTSQLCISTQLKKIGSFKHILSHRVISFNIFTCNINREKRFSWFKSDALDELPLSNAQQKALAIHYVT